MSNNQLDFIWQDREIFFDCKPSQLNDRPGEKVIDSINSVEDTKGNNGERGALIITNLRIKWISHTNTKINLSKSSLLPVLYVLHNNNTSTYLFLNQVLAWAALPLLTFVKRNLNCVVQHRLCACWRNLTQSLSLCSPVLWKIHRVSSPPCKPPTGGYPICWLSYIILIILWYVWHRAYETSKLYRDLKLRGSIIRDGELILLPNEQIFTKVSNIIGWMSMFFFVFTWQQFCIIDRWRVEFVFWSRKSGNLFLDECAFSLAR